MSTDKVLGTIGALNTLVENFPMSILDLHKGKTYTSIFDFLMDVLVACGVPLNEAVEWLLEKIFSVELNLEGGLDNLQDIIARTNFKTEDSEFLNALEYSIKGVLMTLLSSTFGCSSIPVLPSKYMDYPNPDIFEKNENSNRLVLWKNSVYPITLDIPVRIIDPMGMLEITPTTTEGRVFYDIEGIDLYYKKVSATTISSKQILTSYGYKTTKNVNISVNIEKNENNKTYLFLTSDDKLPEKLLIKVEYLDGRGNNLLTWETSINIAKLESEDKLLISDSNISRIINIKINGKLGTYKIHGGINCNLINNSGGIYDYLFENVVWSNSSILGSSNDGVGIEINDEELDEPVDSYDDFNENESKFSYSANTDKSYRYELTEEKPKNFRRAVRVYNIPSEVTEKSPELIVIYKGDKLNDLYKTYDMNAFIWYTMNKSLSHTQREINYTMWDSRLSAKKKGYQNLYSEWYATKSGATGEFKYYNDKSISKDDVFYPILQLKKSPFNLYNINVCFPAQRYYKPNFREKKITQDSGGTFNLSFNSSIYKFNWDYLKSINIFKPKILLTGFVNYLTGGVLYEASTANFNITRNIIKAKLSSAVKNIIEADDMEVEDCYTMFSNDEFNTMLNDMLLSRYNMSQYNGNINKTKTHDVDSYYGMIDSVNLSTSRSESVTKITKLIDEVFLKPGEESSIEYGFESNINTSELFKKLMWAITMPIVESLFTPQVMLLLIINMNLTGVVDVKNFGNNDFSAILNLLFNKIMGMLKSIIKFIKDLIVQLLFNFILKYILPLISKWMLALSLEKLNNWLTILTAALQCLPLFKFNLNKENNMDDVNYADIIEKNIISTPEASSC